MDSTHDNKIFIKEEWRDEFECENFTVQTNTDLTSAIDVKEEPQSLNNFDISIKIEEHEVAVLKEEITTATTTKAIETVFLTEQPLKRTLFCATCCRDYVDYCPRCPMLLRVLDSVVKKGTKNRAKQTLPKKLLRIDEDFGGVFAMQDLPIGVTFGPYEGLDKHNVLGSWFVIKNGRLICTESVENSNWLRYVEYTFTYPSANVVTIQCGDHLFFRSSREIRAGDELLLYLTGDSFITVFQPVFIEQLGETFACMPCCLGFSMKTFLKDHWKVCPHPRSRIKTFKSICDDGTVLVTLPSAKVPEQASKRFKIVKEGHIPGIISIPKAKIKELTCDICDREFPYKHLLHSHKIQVHTPVPCKRSIFTPQEGAQPQKAHDKKMEVHDKKRKVHDKKTKGRKLHKCNYCDFMTEKKCVDFVQHMIHKYDKKELTTSNDQLGVSDAILVE